MLAVVVGTIGFITIFAIAVYACFSDTETFKAIDELIAEHIKSNADNAFQDVESVESVDRKTEPQTEREGE